MSHIVIVTTEPDGKIKLTKDELQKMLDDAYSRGYSDANRITTITYPTYPNWYAETYPKITCSATSDAQNNTGK